jgi:uncharacterized protein
MAASSARVRTTHGAKYVQQLCKHWSHKLDVELSESAGIVRFPAATATMMDEPETLTVEILAVDEATLLRMQDVVASHLDRFGFREGPLNFDWQRRN